MFRNPSIVYQGAGDLVKFVAIFHKSGCTVSVGYVQGVVEGNGVGLLGDIMVQEEIQITGGLFGLKQVPHSPRKQHIGTDLLEKFETEMIARGVTELYGHLPHAGSEVTDCLAKWYCNCLLYTSPSPRDS